MTTPGSWHRELDRTVKQTTIEAVARCDRLPVMDRTVQKVLSLTADAEAQTSELVGALESDPSLAANVLRYANSAYVGRPVRAKTVHQAVAMVGRKAVRRLCLEAVTFRFFESAPGNGRASRGQLHIHAVTVASVAASAARLVELPPDLPHLAGLLHDCGKLVMPLAFGEDEMDAIAAEHPCGVARSEAEWERFGIDHAYAGAVFAEQSGLDPELVAAVALHHGGRFGCSAPSAEIACVQLADVVVAMLGGRPPDQTLLDETLARVGLDESALDLLADSATGTGTPADATGLGARVAELERLASTDELTGLANRRHWMSTVRDGVRDGQGGCVALLDVDHFKQINDTHGHGTGDVVLTEVARVAGRHGVAGRLGGDEFALWLPDCEAEPSVGDRIVAEVADAFTDAALSVSVSLGIADLRGDLAAALDAADRALYAAKEAGRGRARCADSVLSTALLDSVP
jgi:diguanylate cyclase (GGDEF)-like protein/putative nucleotidyltransferase with HDIG domain